MYIFWSFWRQNWKRYGVAAGKTTRTKVTISVSHPQCSKLGGHHYASQMQYEDSNSFLTICSRISWLHFGTQNRRFRWLRARCLPFSRKRHRAQFAVNQQSFARHQLQVSLLHNFWPNGFSNLPVFFWQKWDAWDLILYIMYILREEGTCYSTILPAARGVTSTASHKARFNADKVAQSNHFNREALENWKMIQHFHLGGKEFESD